MCGPCGTSLPVLPSFHRIPSALVCRPLPDENEPKVANCLSPYRTDSPSTGECNDPLGTSDGNLRVFGLTRLDRLKVVPRHTAGLYPQPSRGSGAEVEERVVSFRPHPRWSRCGSWTTSDGRCNPDGMDTRVPVHEHRHTHTRVYVHSSVHTRVHVHSSVHTRVHMHTPWTQSCTHIRTCLCVYTNVCRHMCVWTHTYVLTWAHTTYIYTHSWTRTETYTYTHTHDKHTCVHVQTHTLKEQ